MSDHDQYTYVSGTDQAGQASGTNGLGIAGFIVSMVGLVSCPIVAFVGAILSAVAIRKQPRGFAIAGLVVGLVGTFLTFVVMVAIFLPAIGRARYVAQVAKTQADARGVGYAVEQYEKRNGSLPPSLDSLVSDGLVSSRDQLLDAWGNTLRLEKRGSTFVIVSDGRDGAANTRDDFDAYPPDSKVFDRP